MVLSSSSESGDEMPAMKNALKYTNSSLVELRIRYSVPL